MMQAARQRHAATIETVPDSCLALKIQVPTSIASSSWASWIRSPTRRHQHSGGGGLGADTQNVVSLPAQLVVQHDVERDRQRDDERCDHRQCHEREPVAQAAGTSHL
jgi:hypothetical protein